MNLNDGRAALMSIVIGARLPARFLRRSSERLCRLSRDCFDRCATDAGTFLDRLIWEERTMNEPGLLGFDLNKSRNPALRYLHLSIQTKQRCMSRLPWPARLATGKDFEHLNRCHARILLPHGSLIAAVGTSS